MKYIYPIEDSIIKVNSIIERKSRTGEAYRLIVDSDNRSWITWYPSLTFEVGERYSIIYENKGAFKEIKKSEKFINKIGGSK